MTIKEAKEHGLVNDNSHIDPTRLVIDHEFNKTGGANTSYRDRSINRLIDLKIEFSSDGNIIHDLFQRYVKVECPNCKSLMKTVGGGGNSTTHTIHYHCDGCGTMDVSLTTLNDGFEFRPLKWED